jgi:DNA-directed RNA polymerase II subunit RPB2
METEPVYNDMDKIVAVPPIVKKTEALEFTNPEIPGEIKIDKQGNLLKTWFEYESTLGSLVETFDNWIVNMFPQQLGSRKILIPQGEVTVTNPMFFPPRISVSNNLWEPMTPRMARDNGYTYASEVYVDLVLNKGSPQEEKISQVFFGKVPVMLGSVLCHLRGKTEKERLELGECMSDPFGYFIIKGTEQVILIQEKLRVNRFLLYNASSKGDVVCKMTSNTILGSSNVVLVKNKHTEALEVHLAFMGRASDSKSNKVGNTVSVFQIYRMLGVKDPNQMLRMVSLFTKKEYIKKIWVQLQPTFVRLSQIGDDIEYIAKLKGMGDMDYGIKRSNIMTALQNELFSHIPSTNIEQKLYMLSIMVARMAEYLIGVRKLDDRDNWGNKRLESAGRSLEQLFGNIWREVVTRAQTSIDDKGLQGLQSVRRELDPAFIIDNFVSSFTANNWGVQGSYMPKENITEILKRDSTAAVYAHLTKINTPTGRKGKQLKIRLVQMSQLGFVCMVETPEGAQCGIVKNSAITNYISIERGEDVILERIRGYISKMPTEQLSTPLILNGKFMGWCEGVGLRTFCVNLRRKKILHKDTSVVLAYDGFLYIYSDSSRVTRPLLIIDPTNNKPVIENKKLWNADINTLMEEGALEYIDAFEQEYIQLAPTLDDIARREAALEEATRNHQEAVERLAELEAQAKDPNRNTSEYAEEELRNSISSAQESVSQAAEVLKEMQAVSPYTHTELDPTAILGISASLIPLANHNAGPRNTYECSMGRQALGAYHARHTTRFDTTMKCLAYPTRPMFETQMNQIIGLNDVPAGDTVIVAIATYTGYNQEDAIIMKKSSIDRGLFRQVKYKTHKTVQRRTRDTVEEFGRPEIRPNEKPERYAAIDERGIPRLGSFVREGDCVIGKTRRNLRTGKVDNASIYLGVGEEGIIDRVLVATNEAGMRVMKVKVRQVRKPIIGDKYASRYAQKATIGLILPDEDMPFSASGVSPDIIINPHAIPSRMTLGKMIEIVTSKVAAFEGERVNATIFRQFDVTEFMENLKQYGYSSSGKERLFNGFTGKPMEAMIFIGPCYYQALRHNVKDKVQMRARGGIKALSHQPTGGRAKKGGQRVGEMERDAIISHGASEFLRERLCTVSDAYTPVYCSTCGTIAVSNYAEDKFICRTCGDNAKFGTCTIPYSYKLLTHMLAGAGYNLTFEMTEAVNK